MLALTVHCFRVDEKRSMLRRLRQRLLTWDAPGAAPTRGMFNKLATAWFQLLGGPPCFRVHGKGRREKEWRIIEVHATHRRDEDSIA